MQIRTPRPANRNDDNLAVKLRISVRNHLAVQVRKAELKTRRRIFHGGLLRRIGRPHKLRRTRLCRSPRNEILLIAYIRAQKIRYQQSPIAQRREAVESRSSGGEVANLIGAARP